MTAIQKLKKEGLSDHEKQVNPLIIKKNISIPLKLPLV